jgi:hypothetical protein
VENDFIENVSDEDSTWRKPQMSNDTHRDFGWSRNN